MARTKKDRDRWLASGAPEAQKRLQAALRALGVDVDGLTVGLVDVGLDGQLRATILLGGKELEAVIGALELGVHRWQCPHCGDIYGPDDDDRPPVCDMCKKAGRE